MAPTVPVACSSLDPVVLAHSRGHEVGDVGDCRKRQRHDSESHESEHQSYDGIDYIPHSNPFLCVQAVGVGGVIAEKGTRTLERPSDGFSRVIRGRTAVEQTSQCGIWSFSSLGNGHRMAMIFLGLVLLVLGFVLTVHILWILGIVVLVVGVMLALLGATGRAVGGRPHYF